MNPPLEIVLTRQAQEQIQEAVSWWARNRPSAPGAVREDLDQVLGLLVVQPGIGSPARLGKLKGVRRAILSRIQYFVYYRVTGSSLEILSFWHIRRGVRPKV